MGRKEEQYLIVKDSITKEVVYMTYNENLGYDITPSDKAQRKDRINVSRMILFKPSFIEKVIKKRFEKKTEHLLSLMLEDEESDESDIVKILGEAEKYKQRIKKEYHKFIDEKLELEMLKKLALIERELKIRRTMMLENKVVKTEKSR